MRENSGSEGSQSGQKFLMSLLKDQVFCDDPPRPWTKIKSASGSGGL